MNNCLTLIKNYDNKIISQNVVVENYLVAKILSYEAKYKSLRKHYYNK